MKTLAALIVTLSTMGCISASTMSEAEEVTPPIAAAPATPTPLAAAPATPAPAMNSGVPAQDIPSDDMAPQAMPQVPQPMVGRVAFSTVGGDAFPTDPAIYAMNDVSDLGVLIWWQNMSSEHVATVRFYSPDGQLYLTQTVDMTMDGTMPMDSGRGMWTIFPVGGTDITARGLYGQWHVEVQLDDNMSTSAANFNLVSE